MQLWVASTVEGEGVLLVSALQRHEDFGIWWLLQWKQELDSQLGDG